MQEENGKSNGLVLTVPTLQFQHAISEKKQESRQLEQDKYDEEKREEIKGYPFQNVLIDGKLIKAAKQERRGNKIVLVDPKGKVVHTLSRLDAGYKRRQKRKAK